MPFTTDDKVSVYLVDDDELHLKILKTKFESTTNYKVYAYTSADDFLKDIYKTTFPKKEIVVVILDFFLRNEKNPHSFDGLEVLKSLKALNPAIEIIMLSGLEDVEIATSAMHYGAITFVKKNENSFSRIHNNIKWIISETHLKRRRKESRNTTKIFIAVIFAILVLIIFLKYFFPESF